MTGQSGQLLVGFSRLPPLASQYGSLCSPSSCQELAKAWQSHHREEDTLLLVTSLDQVAPEWDVDLWNLGQSEDGCVCPLASALSVISVIQTLFLDPEAPLFSEHP